MVQTVGKMIRIVNRTAVFRLLFYDANSREIVSKTNQDSIKSRYSKV